MSDIERDYNGNIFIASYSQAYLQLVVGADHLKVIKKLNYSKLIQKDQMTVTSPG